MGKDINYYIFFCFREYVIMIKIGDDMAKKKRKKKEQSTLFSLLVILVLVIGYFYQNRMQEAGASLKKDDSFKEVEKIPSYSLKEIPSYDGKDYVVLDNNKPHFKEEDYASEEFEYYSELDSLGRTQVAFANIGVSLMPIEKRGSIGGVKPSGWHTIKYDIVDGKYLYNRCHLIGYQLTGENANEKNLITCTRQMNTKGMLSFENKVADYIKETNHHVLYRVTPIYENDNLLATGVEIEAQSIEDHEISFHVFVYNVQDGISINYKTGKSELQKDY